MAALWGALGIAKIIPFRLLMMILAALAITCAFEVAYRYVNNMDKMMISLAQELGEEKIATAEAEAATEQVTAAHNAAIDKLNELEIQRAAIDQDTNMLRAQIQNVAIEKDMASDPTKTAAALAARAAQLNRLLERSSQAGNSGALPRAAASPKARTPGSPIPAR